MKQAAFANWLLQTLFLDLLNFVVQISDLLLGIILHFLGHLYFQLEREYLLIELFVMVEVEVSE